MAEKRKRSPYRWKDWGERTCEKCGVVFKPKREWQRFCSKRCREDKWFEGHPRVSVVKEVE